MLMQLDLMYDECFGVGYAGFGWCFGLVVTESADERKRTHTNCESGGYATLTRGKLVN